MNMKKVISVLMVAVALMMAAPAQAQLIKFGLKGGMNFTKLDFDAKSVNEGEKSMTRSFSRAYTSAAVMCCPPSLHSSSMGMKNARLMDSCFWRRRSIPTSYLPWVAHSRG